VVIDDLPLASLQLTIHHYGNYEIFYHLHVSTLLPIQWTYPSSPLTLPFILKASLHQVPARPVQTLFSQLLQKEALQLMNLLFLPLLASSIEGLTGWQNQRWTALPPNI
jgi:hypothetical protein